MTQQHVPVLLKECMDYLNVRPDGTYVDGTLGRGGHSQEIASRLTSGRLVGIDRDEEAIKQSGERLSPFGGKVSLVRGNFRDVDAILAGLGIDGVDGMLFDLGVSSPQLDDASRGFSYMHDAPLDMRMDKSQTLTAWDVVNTWPESEIKRILFEFGEERYAPRIAAEIVRRRTHGGVNTTFELVEIIKSALPMASLREKQHPAKRSFQAIRIAVNDELASISDMLDVAANVLRPGGRLVVISFHSLEDRIIKLGMQSREKGCTCPPDFPVCVCGFKQTMKVLTKRPVVPTDEEIEKNPRARSAKLRAAERV